MEPLPTKSLTVADSSLNASGKNSVQHSENRLVCFLVSTCRQMVKPSVPKWNWRLFFAASLHPTNESWVCSWHGQNIPIIQWCSLNYGFEVMRLLWFLQSKVSCLNFFHCRVNNSFTLLLLLFKFSVCFLKRTESFDRRDLFSEIGR